MPNIETTSASKFRLSSIGALIGALWHNVSFRGLLYQICLIAAIIAVGAYLLGNAQEAMEKRGIKTGFDFLTNESGFAIGEKLIEYSPSDTYGRAYVVAVLNTLKVSIISVVFATILGTLIGIGRLSTNWLISKLSSVYVELFRNTPQLLQIVFWYTLVVNLPQARQALQPIKGFFLSNRGFNMKWPAADPANSWILGALILGCLLAYGIGKWIHQHQRLTGSHFNYFWWGLGIIIILPLLSWLFGGMPTTIETPKMRGFNYVGGAYMSPEFLALMLGLSLYIASFIAEIVRSGIQSVDRGQIEAARALGLSKGQIYRHVILPQALRVMVPPATAQYVSLAKNSSLGVAIGYPELFNVNNTITTESGHTIECIAMMMAVYLSISFTISLFMNWYNRVIQIKER